MPDHPGRTRGRCVVAVSVSVLMSLCTHHGVAFVVRLSKGDFKDASWYNAAQIPGGLPDATDR